jgi:hypothetical protein
MSALESSSFQTPATDFPGGKAILDGNVLDLQVLDPTEGNEQTSLLEVDDEFDVQVTWQLTGANTPVTAGTWIVSLYSDDIDGVGLMNGLIAGPASIPFNGGPSPLIFQHTFQVVPPTPKEGLYQLVCAINFSPVGDPNQLAEMYGFAESTPINIRSIVVETPVPPGESA